MDYIIFLFIVALLIFLALRGFWCWYFKSTEISDTLKRIENLLSKKEDKSINKKES